MKKFSILFLLALLIQSCATKKDVLMFQDIKENNQTNIVYSSQKIQVNDILDIKVNALIPETTSAYNINNSISAAASSPQLLKLQGYLVSIDGEISFPILGKIMVKGKTTSEIEDYLKAQFEIKDQIKNPSVIVRVINSKFTVLGEVRSPGTYEFSEQNITLLQAIGYAGDLTIGAKRKGVLIIREDNGIRQQAIIDLTSTKWFDSPYYYVKQNDIIYVNPSGPVIKSAGYIGNLGTFLSVFTLALSTILLIIR
jgi:polysaccharide export outer membrane protein